MAIDHGFEPVTSNDHRAWLWVVTLLSLVYSLVCMGARLIGKWELLWWDDAVLGLAYAFSFAHYGTLLRAVYAGLGASTSILGQSALTTASQYYFVSRILTFVALGLSKVSVLIFTRRIFSGNNGKEKLFFNMAYGCSAIYGVCAILLSSAGCHPGRALVPEVDAVCSSNTVRWSLITALDVLTEICIFALPLWFLSENKLKSSKKRVVIFLFSFRLVLAAFSIATTATYFTFLNGSSPSIGSDSTIAWQETLLGFSLISASIPCLRSFLWAFMSTGLMTFYADQTTGMGSSNVTGNNHLNSYQSQSRTVASSNRRSQKNDRHSSRTPPSRLRPEWLEYKVDVRTMGDRKSGPRRNAENESLGSDGSEQMIIHRDVEIEVERS